MRQDEDDEDTELPFLSAKRVEYARIRSGTVSLDFPRMLQPQCRIV